MCVLPPLPGGCEGEGQPAQGDGSPPGSRFVCIQLEKNAALHQNERGQGRDPEVREQRSVKVPRCGETLPPLIAAVFPCSGMEVLRYSDVSFEKLASCYPEILSPYMEFAQRLKIEGD